jgi:hypothetical protein
MFVVSMLSALLVGVLVVIVGYTYKKKRDKEEDDLYRQKITEKYSVFNFPVPVSATFCGEDVPLDRDDCYERLDRELMVNTFYHSNTFLCLKRSARFFPIIERILKEEGVPDDLKYLCVIESNLSNVVSPAGAAGYWQFLSATATSYGLEVNENVDERYDIEKSTRAACKFLKECYQQFGKWSMAAAAYNMGRNGLAKVAQTQNETEYWHLSLNEETSRYVFRILAVKEIFSRPESYGYVLRPEDVYSQITSSVVVLNKPILDLAQFCKEHNCKYRDLKFLNPWLRSNQLPNKTGKNYSIQLPQN